MLKALAAILIPILKPVLAIALTIALVVGAVYLGIAYFKDLWPFSEKGDSNLPSVDKEDSHEMEVPERPPTLLIEIRENTIMYDGVELSLDELESILLKHKNPDDTWRLRDTYHADKSTYDEVKKLLNKHVYYREE